MNTTDLAAFNNAVKLAQAGKKEEAYQKLKEIQTAGSGTNDPNLILWLVFTAPQLGESEAYLKRLEAMDPSNSSLPAARQWLAREKAARRPVAVPPPPSSQAFTFQPSTMPSVPVYYQASPSPVPLQPVVAKKKSPNTLIIGGAILFVVVVIIAGIVLLLTRTPEGTKSGLADKYNYKEYSNIESVGLFEGGTISIGDRFSFPYTDLPNISSRVGNRGLAYDIPLSNCPFTNVTCSLTVYFPDKSLKPQAGQAIYYVRMVAIDELALPVVEVEDVIKK